MEMGGTESVHQLNKRRKEILSAPVMNEELL